MPMRSKKQWKYLFASGKPFARRWARMSSYSSLPASKDAGTSAGAPLHGPGGLLATPGLGGTKRKAARWRTKIKDSGYGARAGQVIRGRLVRGADGKFTSSGAAPAKPAAKPAAPRAGKRETLPKVKPLKPAKGRGGRGRAAPKPKPAKPTPEQRQAQRDQERAAERAVNREAVGSALAGADASIGPTGVGMVLSAADGAALSAEQGAALEKLGYAQKNPDGSYRLSPEGNALAKAADRGDTRAALDADGRAQERAAKLAKEQAPKAGGGGGGGKKAEPKPTEDEKRQQQAAERAKRAEQTAPKVGLRATDVQALRTAAEAGGVTNSALESLGFVQDGQTTDQGRRALVALERGDIRQYQAAVQDAKARMAREEARRQRETERSAASRQRDQERQAREAERTAQRQRQLERLRDRARAGGKLTQAQRDALIDAGMAEESGGMWRAKDASTFAVYKDTAGRYRWISRTTTAYRDRDGEIISSAALDSDSQRMTATKQFGPLRYWHVGQPDPGNPAAPWGPGLDLGRCDYSVLIGRTRVESGTFDDPAVALKVAERAEHYEMSPGFFHAIDQPDAGKVYHQIRTFERSIIPRRYSRASNLFTGFTTVKESRMNPEEMERRFKAAITDLGLDAQQATELASGLVQAEKSATDQRIAYKSEEAAEAPQVYTAPDGTQGIIHDGRFVALKAAAAPEPEVAEEVAEVETMADDDMGADVADDLAADDMAMDDESMMDVIGNMTKDEFRSFLLEVMAEGIGPALKLQEMSKAITDQVGELKGMFTTKEAATEQAEAEATKLKEAQAAELATLKEQQATLAAKIAQIEGDQPAVVLPDEVAAALKSEGPKAPEKPEAPKIESTPERPWAGWGSLTFPELYQENGSG